MPGCTQRAFATISRWRSGLEHRSAGGGRELALLARRDARHGVVTTDAIGTLTPLNQGRESNRLELPARLCQVARGVTHHSVGPTTRSAAFRDPHAAKPRSRTARGATDRSRPRTPIARQVRRVWGSCQCWAVPLSTIPDARQGGRGRSAGRSRRPSSIRRSAPEPGPAGAGPPPRRRRSPRGGTGRAGATRGRGRGGRSRSRGSRRRSDRRTPRTSSGRRSPSSRGGASPRARLRRCRGGTARRGPGRGACVPAASRTAGSASSRMTGAPTVKQAGCRAVGRRQGTSTSGSSYSGSTAGVAG